MGDVVVLDTPEWSVKQALLAAHGRDDVVGVYIVTVTKDRRWSTVIGGENSLGDILIASRMLNQRADDCLPDAPTRGF